MDFNLDNYPKWFRVAWKEIGVFEFAKGHNPRVLEYHMETKLEAKADEISWCSPFVNWCFDKAGITGTRSAAARSWLTWGDAIDKPVPGCVVVFWRESKDSWKGHVALYYGTNKDDDIIVLGGNQGDQVSVHTYHRSQLLGYRWPKKFSLKGSIMKVGIVNLLLLTNESAQLASNVAGIFADGKPDWKDLDEGWKMIGNLKDLQKIDLASLQEEAKDLDKVEYAELYNAFKASFNLDNDTIEGAVEEGLGILFTSIQGVLALAALASKIKKT